MTVLILVLQLVLLLTCLPQLPPWSIVATVKENAPELLRSADVLHFFKTYDLTLPSLQRLVITK